MVILQTTGMCQFKITISFVSTRLRLANIYTSNILLVILVLVIYFVVRANIEINFDIIVN